ncbi:adenylate kinase [Malassezia nana]|uniref:Adenylate kinase n=1 Tax=Malassezia nana TaxID=180528 RepID=A0AAF0EGU6_9BASI|nr:adenylate kinase [Malassezia nana]
MQICEAFQTPSGTHPMRHINVGALVKEKGFQASYDAEWDSYEVDEDQLLDYLEPLSGGTAPDPMDEDPDGCEQAQQLSDNDETRGGLVLDWHTCDAWPERWIDLVIVLRCDHQQLWTRLEKRFVSSTHPRNYTEKKIAENNEAEIMGVVLEEALESYPSEAIVTLSSETAEEMDANAERIVAWIQAWRQQRGLPVA